MTGAGPDHAAALARLLNLLASARPADARAVVAALPAADLAAAVDAVQGRASLAIRDHILTENTSPALIALARWAAHGNVEGAANTVDRVLLRFDPEADAAFFDLDGELRLGQRARRLILRDRKGPDGRAVIPPRVKQSLLAAVADAAPDGYRLAELALADDPDLVLALAPHADRLSTSQAANIIATLEAHGRRRDAKRHRALWSGRGREFFVLGFRRHASLHRRYAPLPIPFPAADRSMDALDPEGYRAFVNADPTGYHAVRETALTALRTGTLSAADVLEHTRPAAVAVTLAVCEEDGSEWAGERRAADDVRVLLARYAADRLGDDPERWARVISGVNTFAGTAPELLAEPGAEDAADAADPADPADPYADDGSVPAVNFGSRIPVTVNAANILLAMAPRALAAQILAAESMADTVEEAAGDVPLCRALVEHVLTRGTRAQQHQLAANEATPDPILMRLLERRQSRTVLHTILQRDLVAPEVLNHVYAVVPRDRQLRKWIVGLAQEYPARAVEALRQTADDMPWMLKTLRSVLPRLDRWERTSVEAMLAEVSGAETVWALELDRAGDLESMAPHVRESMATGDAEPLIRAAQAAAAEDAEDESPDLSFDPSREEADLDDPLSQPLEELIRSELDGHVHRWLRLAELLQARPDAADEELIREIGPM